MHSCPSSAYAMYEVFAILKNVRLAKPLVDATALRAPLPRADVQVQSMRNDLAGVLRPSGSRRSQ